MLKEERKSSNVQLMATRESVTCHRYIGNIDLTSVIYRTTSTFFSPVLRERHTAKFVMKLEGNTISLSLLFMHQIWNQQKNQRRSQSTAHAMPGHAIHWKGYVLNAKQKALVKCKYSLTHSLLILLQKDHIPFSFFPLYYSPFKLYVEGTFL